MKNKPRYSTQQGLVTLLFVSSLLAVVLLFSMSSYKSVFIQIKQIQNEVEARRLHWRAEGRLECVMSTIAEDSTQNPENLPYSQCDTPSTISVEKQAGSHVYTVSSREKGYQVAKSFILPGTGRLGAITTTADLMLIGSFSAKPQPVQLVSSPDIYECVSIQYSNNVYLSKTSHFTTSIPTTPGYPSGASCDLSDQTHIANASDNLKLSGENDGLNSDGDSLASEAEFQEDFYYEQNLDPFYDLFGVPKSDIDWVKSKFEVISGGFCHSGVCPCDANIANQIQQGNDLIWVDGHCDLGAATQTNAQNTEQGIIVVVQNGLLGSNGSIPFDGVLFHLNTHFTPSLGLWADTAESTWVTSHYTQEIKDLGAPVPSLFMTGAKVPDGVLIIDSPGSLAMVNGAMDVSYDQKKIDHALSSLRKVRWLRGSWHDF